MPTPAERQALLFVAAVAALGIGVRACRVLDAPGPDRTARGELASQISLVDSVIAAGGARRKSRAEAGPSRAAESGRALVRENAPGSAPRNASRRDAPVLVGPVDVDVASVEELDRLPGIGPALAARIVEDRERNGPFGSLAALDRVRGVGPALSARLRPHVTFSLSPRPHDTEVPAAGAMKRGRRP